GTDAIEARLVADGDEQVIHGSGEGTLSAFIDALVRYGKRSINVVDYSEHAIGTGTDAKAIAYVQLNIDGQRYAGVATDSDTVGASLRAVLSACNRSLHKTARTATVEGGAS